MDNSSDKSDIVPQAPDLSRAVDEMPPSPFSPTMEGFQVLLLAGAAGSAASGILAALDED